MMSGAQMSLRGREISLISSNMLGFQDKNSSSQTCKEWPEKKFIKKGQCQSHQRTEEGFGWITQLICLLALLGERTLLPAPKDGTPTRNHGHISYTNSNKLGLLHIYEAKLQTQRRYLFLRIMIFCNRLRSRVQHAQKETSFTSWYHILVFNFWFCASCKAKRKSVPNLRMSINESPIQHDDNSEKKTNLTQYVEFESIAFTLQIWVFSVPIYLHMPVTVNFTIVSMTKWHHDYIWHLEGFANPFPTLISYSAINQTKKWHVA